MFVDYIMFSIASMTLNMFGIFPPYCMKFPSFSLPGKGKLILQIHLILQNPALSVFSVRSSFKTLTTLYENFNYAPTSSTRVQVIENSRRDSLVCLKEHWLQFQMDWV